MLKDDGDEAPYVYYVEYPGSRVRAHCSYMDLPVFAEIKDVLLMAPAAV
jgi:hypothetical protein